MLIRLRTFGTVLCAGGALLFGDLAAVQAQTAGPAPAAQPPTPAPPATESPSQRVGRLAKRLLQANVQRCPKQRWDFGLFAHRDRMPQPGSSPAPQGLPAEPDGFRVVQVWPGGPAEQAGIRLGDQVMAANGADWAGADFGEVFRKAEQADPALAQITFRMAQGKGLSDITVAGQRACAIFAVLVPRDVVNASANSTTAFINSGLEQALPQDDELAAVIAHEIAHVMLGHSPAMTGPKADRPNRGQIEQDADALGVRLMLSAGVDPTAAVRAVATIGAHGRGPISRLLGLYGSYLPTPERQRFLLAQIATARAESAAPKPEDQRKSQ